MKKIENLILHIGKFKTGTTSIQRTFGSNREKLLKYDIYYPGIIPYNHLFTLPFIFFDNPVTSPEMKKRMATGNSVDSIISSLKELWINEFKKCNCSNFVISAESLCTMSQSEVVRFKNFLMNYFLNIKVVVYIRHIESLVASMAQQEIKNGFSRRTIEEIIQDFLNSKSKIIYYRESLDNWLKAYGIENIIIRPFEKNVLKNGNVVDDFIEIISPIKENLRLKEVRSNISFGYNVVAFLERYNRKYPMFKKGVINRDRGLASRFPFGVFRDIPDKKLDLKIKYTDDQIEKINSEIDYINNFLKECSFEHIVSRDEENSTLDAKKIPVDFYVDLINNYNKKMEPLLINNAKNQIDIQIDNTNNKKIDKYKDIIYKVYLKRGNLVSTIIRNLIIYCRYKLLGLVGFDKYYYKATYPYVTDRAKDPLLHFLVRGVYLGYDPNPEFDTKGYILENPEIIATGENALVHCNKRGSNRYK